MISRRLSEAGKDWKERTPPGLTALWNLFGIRAGLSDMGDQHLERILERGIIDSARVNVHLLDRLSYWFLFPENSPRLLNDDALRRLIVQAFARASHDLTARSSRALPWW